MTHDGPKAGPVQVWAGRFWMWLTGWQVVGEVPRGGRFVLVGAPHTSGWDFLFTLAATNSLGLRISWLGKHTLFQWPLGPVMRRLGGIAINRESRHGVVEQLSQRFKDSRQLVVAVAPSGTRGRTDYWKSGFYWIAHTARVPILCGSLDYDRKKARIGLSLLPTGDIKRDMDRIRGFYQGVRGRFPEKAARIRLREEDGDLKALDLA